MKAVEEQIKEKKYSADIQKSRENELVTLVNEKVMEHMENEEMIRQNRIVKIKQDFAEGNKILIQRKAERREVDNKYNLINII
jgi:hypothetical protein